VAEGIARLLGPPAGGLEVLDAGCGTGLCAPSLRPYARRLVGVDLSSEMVKRADDRHLYDELVVDELTAFLTGHPAAYDLVASADTLCYFGELAPPLSAAATALRSGGHLVFTVERATDAPAGYQLNPHGRYSHTDAYVRATLAGAGLTPVMIAAGFLRMESKQPVAGLLVAARR
jgi:predicted TPR repeat methyltransferase